MSDCMDSTAYTLHEQLACTSSTMNQHQAAKAEPLELKCEVCGNLISSSSDGSSRCLLCQGNLKCTKLKYEEDHIPLRYFPPYHFLPDVGPCPKPEYRYSFLYHQRRPEDFEALKAKHLMTRLTLSESQKQGH